VFELATDFFLLPPLIDTPGTLLRSAVHGSAQSGHPGPPASTRQHTDMVRVKI
jgi:hypothetical protein